jgi:hypothetical protein
MIEKHIYFRWEALSIKNTKCMQLWALTNLALRTTMEIFAKIISTTSLITKNRKELIGFKFVFIKSSDELECKFGEVLFLDCSKGCCPTTFARHVQVISLT